MRTKYFIVKSKHLFVIFLISTLSIYWSCKTNSADFYESSVTNAINGSSSRVIVVGDYIYIAEATKLKTINTSNPQNMIVTDNKDIGFNIQTIYHNNGNLYIGAAQNLYTYSLSNPAIPSSVSTINYAPLINPRDPVIAFDSVVYSTVSFGNGAASSGVLRVINNKNPQNQIIINTFNLSNPRGLDKKDSILYVCNGLNGIAKFNINKPFLPVPLTAFGTPTNNDDFYDVIVFQNILYCYIKGGIANFNISNPANPIFLSKVN